MCAIIISVNSLYTVHVQSYSKSKTMFCCELAVTVLYGALKRAHDVPEIENISTIEFFLAYSPSKA